MPSNVTPSPYLTALLERSLPDHHDDSAFSNLSLEFLKAGISGRVSDVLGTFIDRWLSLTGDVEAKRAEVQALLRPQGAPADDPIVTATARWLDMRVLFHRTAARLPYANAESDGAK